MLNTQIPRVAQHRNSHSCGETVYWTGTDQFSAWQENIKNYPEFFAQHGWDHPKAIAYQYNSHGFRDEEFDDRPAAMALGCSFTEGTGLNSWQTWPKVLQNRLGQHVWNLGVGGSSLDTCFRLLDYYVNQLTVSRVFLLVPAIERVEFFTHDRTPKVFLPREKLVGDHKTIYMHWTSCSANLEINQKKNLLAMRHICAAKNIPLFELDNTHAIQNIGSLARDLCHGGIEAQVSIAAKFYDVTFETSN